MPVCFRCKRDLCLPCIAANDNDPLPEPVVVATDDELRDGREVRKLAAWLVALDLPRRRIPDRLADLIFGHDGPIVWPDGSPFSIPDTLIDDTFGAGDPEFKWLGDVQRFAEAPPRQAPHASLLPRWRLLHLAFQLADRT